MFSSLVSSIPQEHALQLADFRHMELTLEDHQIPREMWKEYGIPALIEQKKKKMKKKGVQDFSEAELDEEEVLEPLPFENADTEQDITVVTGVGLQQSVDNQEESNATTQKVYWKGMEFIEEHDEFEDKELVVLKANSGFLVVISRSSFVSDRFGAVHFHGFD